MSVSICPTFLGQALQAGYCVHGLQRQTTIGRVLQQVVISHNLQAKDSQIKMQAASASAEDSFWFPDGCLLVVSSHGERGRALISSSVSTLIPTWEFSPLHDLI